MIEREIVIDTKREDIDKDLTLIRAHPHKAAIDVRIEKIKKNNKEEDAPEVDHSLFTHNYKDRGFPGSARHF